MLDVLLTRGCLLLPLATVALVPGLARADAGGEGTGEPAGEGAQAEAAEEPGDVFYGRLSGEYQLRLNAMKDIPLQPLPRDEAGTTGTLGQNHWAWQWFRLGGELGLRSRLRVVGEVDVFKGVVFGDSTQGVGAAAEPRDDATEFPGITPRALYAEWTTPVGLLRAGLMTSHWGLGIVANDGAHEPVFGDYVHGDTVARVAFATKPAGAESPFVVAVAGDLVYDDITADLEEGDTAWQGVLAAYYQKEQRTAGLYAVRRRQRSEVEGPTSTFEDRLDVWVGDLYVKWDIDEPSGGRLFAATELAWVRGESTLFRTTVHDEHRVEQFMAVGQVGRVGDFLDVVLEGGYASGDSNTEDRFQRRATLDPDHRVGLILFPEVMAWNTARSATLARSEELFGRPAPGSRLLPTQGGVSGACYLSPTAVWRPRRWLELRAGAVWARATSAVVDPFAQRARSTTVNYQGGDPLARDLGLELDGAVLVRRELHRGVELSGGLEGGYFFPGHAFDGEGGDRMRRVGLARLRVGLRF